MVGITRDQSCAFPLRARKYRRSASVTTSDFFRISLRQTSSSAFSISEGTVTEMALYLAEAFKARSQKCYSIISDRIAQFKSPKSRQWRRMDKPGRAARACDLLGDFRTS